MSANGHHNWKSRKNKLRDYLMMFAIQIGHKVEIIMSESMNCKHNSQKPIKMLMIWIMRYKLSSNYNYFKSSIL